MYKTSEKFKNAVYGNSRTFLAKVSDGTHSASEEILSLKQTSRSVADDCISVGGAVSSYVEIKMWDPGFALDGTELEISIGMVIDSKAEWVPLGIFTAQKPKSDNGVVTFTAYDRIQTRMSGAFISELTYPCDGKTVLAEMEKNTGVPIVTTDLPDGVMIPKRAVSTDSIVDESGNPVTDTKYVTPFDGYTYREALSYIAQFYGMFATMDRSGNVVFRWYTVADCSISADRYYDDLTLGESVFTVEKIICQAGNDTLSAGEGTACMRLENPVMTQERLTAVYQQIKGLEFLPASVSFLGDPRIDVGDIITVTDKTGNVVKIPVMSLVQDYDGGLLSEVQSFGKTESETAQNKGPVEQKMDRLYKDLFLVKELVGEKASFGYVYSVSAKVRKLETETISADRLDVNGIFAKDVTATGTITGAILKGAAVSCSGPAGVMELRKGGLNGFYTAEKDNYRYTYGCAYTSTSLSLDYTKESLTDVDVQKVYVLYADSSGVNIGNLAKFSLDEKNVTFSCPTTFNDTLIAKGLSVGDIYATSISVQNSGVELYGSTPFIDFHFNKSNTDYTSRIIELEKGKLNINGAVFIDGGTIWGTGLSVAGKGTFGGDLSATRGLTLKHNNTSLYIYNESGTFCIMHTGADGKSSWPILWNFASNSLAVSNALYCSSTGTFDKGITSKAESIFHTGSYTDPYPGKVCTIKSWGTLASLRFAAKGTNNTWLSGAKTDGAAYDTICLDAGAFVPGWRVRTIDGAWVGASYALDPGFRIYYCKNDRLAGDTNATDAVYNFSASGTFYTKALTQTSDEREKNIISGITDRYEDLFMRLKPVLFSWKTGSDGIHMGFGAQTVLQQVKKCGLTENELAAVHQGKGEGTWSLGYSEFIPLTVKMTQKSLRKIADVEETVNTIREETAKIAFLQAQIEQLYSYIGELKMQISERR